jgi:hypothetical protein
LANLLEDRKINFVSHLTKNKMTDKFIFMTPM